MHHPDDLTPGQEFKILLDEQPARAEAILAQGSEALDVLNSVARSLKAILGDEMMHQSRVNVGRLDKKDSLPSVAMKYGILYDRHSDMVNNLISMHMGVVLSLQSIAVFCPGCGEPHLAAEAADFQEPEADPNAD
jgi:hypothetical protein